MPTITVSNVTLTLDLSKIYMIIRRGKEIHVYIEENTETRLSIILTPEDGEIVYQAWHNCIADRKGLPRKY